MNIIVIGGGASGLIAAIKAAQNGAKVTVLEKNNKIGEKIKITGNGQCNITNLNMSAKHFYGDESFINSVIKKLIPEETIKMFQSMGLYCCDMNGYVYPRSKQAASVVNTLRDYALNLGIKIKTNNVVSNISASSQKFLVDIGITLECDRLIIATGGLAAPNTGSTGEGFKFAQNLGHSITELKPALTALICKESNINIASGVRSDCTISVFEKNQLIGSEFGQLQITDYGVSGIPIFNLSHLITKERYIEIDFLSEYSKEEFENIIYKNSDLTVKALLCGLFKEKLVKFFLREAGIKETVKCSELQTSHLNQLLCVCKNYQIHNLCRRGFDFAQVTQGGIPTDEINPDTMESKIVKNLYFCGEIINVDGICGGYNLQFAWSSGYIAGDNSSK